MIFTTLVERIKTREGRLEKWWRIGLFLLWFLGPGPASAWGENDGIAYSVLIFHKFWSERWQGCRQGERLWGYFNKLGDKPWRLEAGQWPQDEKGGTSSWAFRWTQQDSVISGGGSGVVCGWWQRGRSQGRFGPPSSERGYIRGWLGMDHAEFTMDTLCAFLTASWTHPASRCVWDSDTWRRRGIIGHECMLLPWFSR